MASTSNVSVRSGSNSPPRGLKDILSTEQKTIEFESFLEAIDQENEDQVMVTRLKFVLKCRVLADLWRSNSYISSKEASVISKTRDQQNQDISHLMVRSSFNFINIKTFKI